MSAAILCGAVLALAVCVGTARLLLQSWQAAAHLRPRAWRTGLLLSGQAVAAILLYLAMFPPQVRTTAGVLAVITANASSAQLARIDPGARIMALADAPAIAAAERIPDLATALRRYPSATRLKVIGAGLSPRDLESVTGLSIEFDPAPLPRGLVELWFPRHVPSGASWRITGAVNAVPQSSVELLDPSARRVARARLATDGRFVLQAQVRTPGRAHFRLRVIDDTQRVIDDVDVPLLVMAAPPLRVLVLSGAPSPELKYLRRWALDSGVELQSEIFVRPGVRVLRSSASLTPDALRELDLVVLDERAWRSLGTAGRGHLAEALRDGLGVVIRLTGTLTPREHGELQELGFDVRGADLPRTTRLADVPTALTRRPLQVVSRDGVPLVRNDRGEPLAVWRAEGRGRVALWWLSDSFRLALDGSAGYGALWSQALTTLARASDHREPTFAETASRVNRRQVICDVDADASVQAPDGKSVPLLREVSGCAAYWPASAGWHVLSTGGGDWSFHVRAANEAPALDAGDLRAATAAYTANRTQTGSMSAPGGLPGSPWPYLLACLAALGGTWWLERSKAGRRLA
jgi:hypothetical protein